MKRMLYRTTATGRNTPEGGEETLRVMAAPCEPCADEWAVWESASEADLPWTTNRHLWSRSEWRRERKCRGIPNHRPSRAI